MKQETPVTTSHLKSEETETLGDFKAQATWLSDTLPAYYQLSFWVTMIEDLL